MTPATKSPSRRDGVFAFVVLGAIFAALTFRTWRKWPDLIVDFGFQLYVPWRLANGAVFHRDLAYLDGGPVSQYYNALLFKIFGTSFLTLALANLAAALILLWVLYRCFYRCSDQLTALTICLTVEMLFVFAHPTELGIFNYITPYCSEIVHGLILSVIAIALLAKWIGEQKVWPAAVAGLCCGLAFLTKPEVFLSLAATVAVGIFLFRKVNGHSPLFARSLGVAFVAVLVGPLGFFLYFLPKMDASMAVQAVGSAWLPLLAGRKLDNPFFRWCLGLDMPGLLLERMLLQFFGLTLCVASAAFLCRRRPLALVAGGTLCALALWLPWGECGQSLPLISLALLGLLLWQTKKSGWRAEAAFPLLWTVFGIVMLAKLGLFSRIWHYGFVLGMPAMLSAVYLLLWVLPQELKQWHVNPIWLRAAFWFPMMIGFASLTERSLHNYALKTLPVGKGADCIIGYPLNVRPYDTAVRMAVRWLDINTPPNSTLAVLPAEPMINYLSRRVNPCRYTIWPPPEIAAFGQQNMSRDFIQHAPDYVILHWANYGEFGEKTFGLEPRFGKDVMDWINAHYQLKLLIGDDWMRTGRYGMKILQKKPG